MKRSGSSASKKKSSKRIRRSSSKKSRSRRRSSLKKRELTDKEYDKLLKEYWYEFKKFFITKEQKRWLKVPKNYNNVVKSIYNALDDYEKGLYKTKADLFGAIGEVYEDFEQESGDPRFI